MRGGTYQGPPHYSRSYPYFRRLIRAHEFAERQNVSMIDVFGRNRGLRRAKALWSVGIDTCDKLLVADVDQLATDIAGLDGLPDDIGQVRIMINAWKAEILRIKTARDQSSGSVGPKDSAQSDSP